MAVDVRPDTLQRLQTELMVCRAQRADLLFKVRQRQFVDRAKLRDATIRRAMRVRDHLTTAPARHAPTLAAEFGLQMEHVHAALSDFMEVTLRWIAAREFVMPEPAPTEPGETAEVDSVSQI
jgi:hypothetical protein